MTCSEESAAAEQPGRASASSPPGDGVWGRSPQQKFWESAAAEQPGRASASSPPGDGVWGRSPQQKFWEDDAVEVHRVVVGRLATNVYGVRCRATGVAVVVDAPAPAAPVLGLYRQLGAHRALLTHGHHDHIGAVADLRRAGYPVAVAAGDAAMLPAHDALLGDDEVLEVGRLRLRTIATPGHTPGSTAFAIEGSAVVLVGDTLFPGGPGATRWPYSDFGTILRSIEGRLFARFADSTVVLPGHGDPTTIGAERPHLAAWAARGW